MFVDDVAQLAFPSAQLRKLRQKRTHRAESMPLKTQTLPNRRMLEAAPAQFSDWQETP